MKTQTPHFKWKPTLVIGTRSWSITVASVAPRVRVMVQITSANGTTFFSVPLTKHTKSASELNSQGKASTRPGASPAGKLERWDQVKKWCFSIVNQFHPTLLIIKYNAMMLWNQFHPIFFSANYELCFGWLLEAVPQTTQCWNRTARSIRVAHCSRFCSKPKTACSHLRRWPSRSVESEHCNAT